MPLRRGVVATQRACADMHPDYTIEPVRRVARLFLLPVARKVRWVHESATCAGGARATGEPRQRLRVAYAIPPFGRMCRQAYILLWDIGLSALQALLTYMASHANTFPHGLAGTVSNNVLTPELQQQIIAFIQEIGEAFGEEAEGRQGRRNAMNSAKL